MQRLIMFYTSTLRLIIKRVGDICWFLKAVTPAASATHRTPFHSPRTSSGRPRAAIPLAVPPHFLSVNASRVESQSEAELKIDHTFDYRRARKPTAQRTSG